MARRISISPAVMMVSFAASLTVGTLTAAIGMSVLSDVNRRSEELEKQYLEKRQIAVRGQAELGYARRELPNVLAQGDAARHEAFVRHMDAVAGAVRQYEFSGNVQSAERRPIAMLKQAVLACRAAADRLAEKNAPLPQPDKAFESSGRLIAQAFDALAAFSSNRAMVYDQLLRERVEHLSGLLVIIAVLGLVAGIPAGLWVVHVCRARNLLGERPSEARCALPEAGAVA